MIIFDCIKPISVRRTELGLYIVRVCVRVRDLGSVWSML